jgi:hypothetical protein
MAEGRTDFAVDADGWYVEPTAATRFLLAREYFTGGVWDPACGQGNIVETCLLEGLDAVGTDLRQRVTPPMAWFLGTLDFVAGPVSPWWSLAGAANVICNPPYGRAKLAEAFIRRALALPGLRKAAFFVNGKFIFGSGRAAGLYAELAPDRVYPVNPRPSCPPGSFLQGGGKAEGGVENFVWLVWDLAAPTGRSEIIWAAPATGAPSRHSQAPQAPETETTGRDR